MALANEQDIQVHLPIDKFKVEDIPDSVTDVLLDAERVIKGRLAGTFSPTTLSLWDTPATTPKMIRAIAGRLCAALLYRLRLSQDSPDDSEYAQQKYGEAMLWLEGIATGQIVLDDVEEEVDTGGHLSTNHYVTLPDPKFTMDSVF